MNESELQAIVLKALRNVAPEVATDQIRLDADLRDQLDIDSMDFIRLMAAIEKEVGVRLEELDRARITSVNDLVAIFSTALARSVRDAARQ